MPVIDKPRTDPLKGFKEGLAAGGRGGRPIPLARTAIAVAVRAGFATVTTSRTFRNAEAESIEATMTWPVPVDAVVHGLKVTVAGRELVGAAVARERAGRTTRRRSTPARPPCSTRRPSRASTCSPWATSARARRSSSRASGRSR